MTAGLLDWDGEFLVQRRDAKTGALLCVALHRRRPFPAGGGTRIRSYAREADLLDDVCRLSQAMSFKFALLDLPRGGGKGVIGLPPDLDPGLRAGLLERYGDLVESLGGAFSTGPDYGSTPADMDVIGRRTRHVFGRSESSGGSGSSGPMTARGVFGGIRAALEHAFANERTAGAPAQPAGRRIVVQGAGSVGGPLISLLAGAGAEVIAADSDPGAPARVESLLGGPPVIPVRWIDPREVFSTPCDLFAPCAAGGLLHEETIPLLNCRVVAGAANNPLATVEDAERLRARGILYAPDFVINGGGAIHLLGREQLGWTVPQVEQATDRIATTLARVLRDAEAASITPLAAALALAAERLAVQRQSPPPEA
jgi:leucine dehydrogenase